MGLMFEKGSQFESAYGSYNPSEPCFYCYRPLSGEVILNWMGSSKQDLYLHPGCFLELVTRMFRDLHQIELKADYHVTKNASPKDAKRDETVVRQ
jgi:hypothetical protein